MVLVVVVDVVVVEVVVVETVDVVQVWFFQIFRRGGYDGCESGSRGCGWCGDRDTYMGQGVGRSVGGSPGLNGLPTGSLL